MNRKETIDALAALDRPAAKQDPMVYRVWEDGEITLEKGGDLFGQRTLHCVSMGRSTLALAPTEMPYQNFPKTHGYLFAANKEDAERAQRWIFDLGATA